MSSKSDLSRREFLTRVGAAGLVLPALTPDNQALAQAAPGRPLVGRMPRRLLTRNDFVYRGCFRMPLSINGQGDPAWGFGLAHRRVNGELRFFSKAHGNPPPAKVYEVAAPATLADLPTVAPTASLRRIWGNIGGADVIGEQRGLFWDDTDQRLYWAAGENYNAVNAYDPSIGYATLDDASGTFVNRGVWGFTGRSCKMAMGGLVDIPQWFSDAYCKGRRLGAGFGGNFSVATTGPISMGPALTAFNPADFGTTASRGAVKHTPMLSYPFHQGSPYSTPTRAQRDTDYINDFDQWNPRNGIGYWTWTDTLWQGGIWIDTPTKTGLLFMVTMGNGRTWYQTSTIWCERSSHSWSIYDPSDLAQTAQGKKAEWDLQPKEYWLEQYAGINYPIAGWRDGPTSHVIGTTFDAQTSTLYVGVRFALGMVQNSPVIVYAYQVV